jgi:hypothetical protein
MQILINTQTRRSGAAPEHLPPYWVVTEQVHPYWAVSEQVHPQIFSDA